MIGIIIGLLTSVLIIEIIGFSIAKSSSRQNEEYDNLNTDKTEQFQQELELEKQQQKKMAEKQKTVEQKSEEKKEIYKNKKIKKQYEKIEELTLEKRR